MTDAPPLESGPKIVAMPLDEARRARGESVVALPRSKVASLRAFRRVRADRVFGTIGTILVIAGLILAFKWPAPAVHPPPTYKVEWPETRAFSKDEKARLDFPSQPSTSNPPAPSKVYTEKVDQVNVTKINFWLTWKDDLADPAAGQADGDNFSLMVKGPSNYGFTQSATGGAGGANISYSLPESGIPDKGSVPAKTYPEALKALGDYSNKTAMGDWTFTVTLLHAGDKWDPSSPMYEYRDQVPCSAPYCQRDTGNDFTFHFEFYTYMAKLSKQA